jgi:tRNA A37 methylthiotransferase MiaB
MCRCSLVQTAFSARCTAGTAFTYLHVFSFSARPGTKAADLGAPVSAAVTRDRARALRALGQQRAAAFREVQAGRTLRALTLARGGDTWTEALTGNYLKARVEGRHPANVWCEARISSAPEAAEREEVLSSRR